MRDARDGVRCAFGRRPAGWAAATAFAAEAERIVDALSRMRLRVSLYIMRFDGLPTGQATALAEEALGEIGLVGRLPDRSIGLLVIDAAASPVARRASLAQRLSERLRASGAVAGDVVAHVAERHGWTDDFAGAAHIVEETMDATTTPLPLNSRLAG
jgi:hypothetical protein